MKINVNQSIVNISQKNSKMGNVHSFSVPPVVTCAAGVPCRRECYAAKLCKMYSGVRNTWTENLNAIMYEDHEKLVDVFAGYINLFSVKLFRWNVGGDFNVPGYFELTLEVAKRCPGCRFLAFTKCYNYANIKRPKNYNLVLSAWNDYSPDNVDDYAIAYYFDGSRALPGDAVECGGNCESCMRCFYLRPGEKVFFKKH